MRLIILLPALAIALPFVISSVALPFGSAVYMRFLERPANTDVPKAKLRKSARLFLTTTHAHPEHASGQDGFPSETVVIRRKVQQQELDEVGATMIDTFRSRNETPGRERRRGGAPDQRGFPVALCRLDAPQLPRKIGDFGISSISITHVAAGGVPATRGFEGHGRTSVVAGTSPATTRRGGRLTSSCISSPALVRPRRRRCYPGRRRRRLLPRWCWAGFRPGRG